MTQANTELQAKLIRYIEDAYALEAQIEEVLEKQITATADAPVVQAKIRQHLAETQIQKKRMAQRLEAYGKHPSAVKVAVGNLMGNLAGIAGGLRPDMHSRMMRDDYVTEHLEIAGYTYLITTAKLCGDEETVRLAELTLKEEIAMAEWLALHLNDGLLKDFQNDQIQLPASATELKAPTLSVTWEPETSEISSQRS